MGTVPQNSRQWEPHYRIKTLNWQFVTLPRKTVTIFAIFWSICSDDALLMIMKDLMEGWMRAGGIMRYHHK